MSSPYVKLGDRSLDQWKVTELKDELKRRRLPIKGLKEDLVKRLDQALRTEMENSAEEVGNGSISTEQKDFTVDAILVHEIDSTGVVGEIASDLQDSEILTEATEMVETVEDGSKGEKADTNDQPTEYQVSAVDLDLGAQVKSGSISTEALSILEKNELTQDINNVNLVSDVKLVTEQNSVGGESHQVGVVQSLDSRDSIENNVDSVLDLSSGDHEKLSLEGSSGDDSPTLDEKQAYAKSSPNEIKEKSDLPKQEDDVDIVGHDKPVNFKGPVPDSDATTHEKRKFDDQEGTGNNDSLKRPRRLNLEGSKVSDPQVGNVVPSATPNATELPTFKRAPAIDPSANSEAAKERHVPPPNNPPTNSLRIDQFVRPFTLKAVQELLGKTGTVTDFWMDQIKTHCYVSYSSVEEAIETRNAVYNLRWPVNGGRLLIAEFVDPQEVKTRVEAPPSTPLSATPTPQGKPSQQFPKHNLPPPPLLSEPPISRERPPPMKERLSLAPPPPPATEKFDPPIVTLDDLFKKTKATPRIYYLPLSDEEVAAKIESQGKNVA